MFLLTDAGKLAPAYLEGVERTSFMKYKCFDYINEYGIRKQELDKRTGVWLVREYLDVLMLRTSILFEYMHRKHDR